MDPTRVIEPHNRIVFEGNKRGGGETGIQAFFVGRCRFLNGSASMPAIRISFPPRRKSSDRENILTCTPASSIPHRYGASTRIWCARRLFPSLSPRISPTAWQRHKGRMARQSSRSFAKQATVAIVSAKSFGAIEATYSGHGKARSMHTCHCSMPNGLEAVGTAPNSGGG